MAGWEVYCSPLDYSATAPPTRLPIRKATSLTLQQKIGIFNEALYLHQWGQEVILGSVRKLTSFRIRTILLRRNLCFGQIYAKVRQHCWSPKWSAKNVEQTKNSSKFFSLRHVSEFDPVWSQTFLNAPAAPDWNSKQARNVSNVKQEAKVFVKQ